MMKKILLTICLYLLSFQMTFAATLLQYNFTTDFDPSTTAAGVTGGTATNGSLSTFSRASDGYASDPENHNNPASGATSEAGAVSNSSYFSFTITPNAGQQISLTTMTFNAARGGASTPRGYGVRSSQDGYAADLATADLATVRPNWTAVSVDLSGASFQNQTSAITFRVYIYAPTTGNSVEDDDVTINGTVNAVTGTAQSSKLVMSGGTLTLTGGTLIIP